MKTRNRAGDATILVRSSPSLARTSAPETVSIFRAAKAARNQVCVHVVRRFMGIGSRFADSAGPKIRVSTPASARKTFYAGACAGVFRAV